MSFTAELKEDILTFKNNNKTEKKLELESMLRISSEISLIPRKLIFDAPTLGIIRRFLATLKEFYQFEYLLMISRTFLHKEGTSPFVCKVQPNGHHQQQR